MILQQPAGFNWVQWSVTRCKADVKNKMKKALSNRGFFYKFDALLGPLAQWLEQRTHNPFVWGSQPAPDHREGWREIPEGPHFSFLTSRGFAMTKWVFYQQSNQKTSIPLLN